MSASDGVEKARRLRDNRQINKRELNVVEGLVSRICDRTLGDLENEGVFIFPLGASAAKDVSPNQIVLRTAGDTVWTSNVMGFLGYKDERLVIESRFSDDGDDFFLEYLLTKVTGCCPNLVNLKTDANLDTQLFNWLIFLFPHVLKSALRKGTYKTYIRRELNDGNVRGTIDVARHLRDNTPFLGKVAYVQRQFTVDNRLMELVRHTIEYFKREKDGRIVLSEMRDEIAKVTESTPFYRACERWEVIVANKRNPIRHSYFREYQALQSLCLMILQHQRHSIGGGRDRVFGILFDGSWLWEEYVNELIGDAFYHPENRKGDKGNPQPIFCDFVTGKCVGKMFPDFLGRGANRDVIADAKYKPKQNIGQDDYFQILSYMFRFDAKKGYFLYPVGNERNDPKENEWSGNTECLFLCRGNTYDNSLDKREDIAVVKMGLGVPTGCGDYDLFAKAMEMSEQEFKQNVEMKTVSNCHDTESEQ